MHIHTSTDFHILSQVCTLSFTLIAQPPQISILSPLMYFFIFMYIVFHFELCVLILTHI